jgi:hypothetical protein
MADAASLLIKVKSSGITKTTKDLKGLETQGSKATAMTKSLGKSFVRLGAVAGVAAAALGVGLFVKSIKNTIEQERVIAQLNQTLKSTGRFSVSASEGLQDYAAELQKLTTFSDETIIASQALILTFTRIGSEIMPQTTEAVLNVATAMGTDLKSASIQVGKALNDPLIGLSALSESGITFSQVQKDLVKDMIAVGNTVGAQKLILKELETQFGGSAFAARNTLGGSLKSLSNSFGDLLEADKGSPSALTDSINQLTMQLNSKETKDGIQALVTGFFKIADGATKAISAIGNFFADETIAEKLAEIEGLKARLNDGGIFKYAKQSNEKVLILQKIVTLEKEILALENKDRMDFTRNLKSGGQNVNSNSDNTGDKEVKELRSETYALSQMATEYDNLFSASQALNESIRTPKEIFDQEIQALDKLKNARNERLNESLISQETYNRARIESEQKFADSQEETAIISADAMSTIDESLFRSKNNFDAFGEAIESWGMTFAQTMVNGSGSFKDFASTVVKQMQVIAIQQATQPLFDGFSGSFKELFSTNPISGSTANLTGGGAPSANGGGFTGTGARVGGVDGIGGFPAILHPNETVIDHTKGQTMGNVVVNVDASGTSTKGDSQKLGNMIGVAVRSILIEESRQGGLLA